MVKKDPENCWEFWNCVEKNGGNCPVYLTNSGKDCWRFSSTLCTVSKSKDSGHNCLECDWYKKVNS